MLWDNWAHLRLLEGLRSWSLWSSPGEEKHWVVGMKIMWWLALMEQLC